MQWEIKQAQAKPIMDHHTTPREVAEVFGCLRALEALRKFTGHYEGPCYFPSGISITKPPMTSSILKSFLGLCGWVL